MSSPTRHRGGELFTKGDKMAERDWSEVRRACDEASEAPWVFNRDTRDMLPRVENGDGDRQQLWWKEYDDNRFICVAREALPTALDEIDRLREALASERERAARIAESDLGLVWIHPQHADAVQSAIARKIREGEQP